MSIMSDSDRAQLLEDAGFLLDKGYVLTNVDEHGFRLVQGNIMFSVSYERYEDSGDISIRFLHENKVFLVSWLSNILDKDTNDSIHRLLDRKLKSTPPDQVEEQSTDYSDFDNLRKLLMVVKDNYDDLLDINFCRITEEESTALYRLWVEKNS